MSRKKTSPPAPLSHAAGEPAATYDGFITGLSGLLDRARAAAARAVNGVITATARHGRGFSRQNLQLMRALCPGWRFAGRRLAFPARPSGRNLRLV